MFLSREELENIQQSLADGEADERSYSLSSLQVWHGPPCHSELADLVVCVREARLLQLCVPWPRQTGGWAGLEEHTGSTQTASACPGATGLHQLLAPQPTGLRPRAHSSCWCLGQYTHMHSPLFFHACSLAASVPPPYLWLVPYIPEGILYNPKMSFPTCSCREWPLSLSVRGCRELLVSLSCWASPHTALLALMWLLGFCWGSLILSALLCLCRWACHTTWHLSQRSVAFRRVWAGVGKWKNNGLGNGNTLIRGLWANPAQLLLWMHSLSTET